VGPLADVRPRLQILTLQDVTSEHEVEWGEASMPFKPHDATPNDAYHVEDDPNLEDMTSRIKRILDAKYEPANLDEVVDEQADDSLSNEERQKL